MIRTLLTAFVLSSGLLLSQARAAPPTVTPSPGYDARLQEERAGRTTIQAPVTGQPQPRFRRQPRRLHHARR